ncbi:MAG TPA: trypsin-like peptidase domain-containing protein [Methylophilaceae bacterium]|nr:trypsin-like peptidase domain-containing protein [Methylophilaceae bacterium]
MHKLAVSSSMIFSLALFTGHLQLASAETSEEVAFKLNPSIVKVQVDNDKGNRGIGSGVVVSQDQVVTNCHVVANARGIAVTKNGESYPPVSMKADWHHDLCILKFEGLPIAPVTLGDNTNLKYEQEVFSIGYPNNPMKPLTAFGKIKGLYQMDDSQVIRTSAAFRMGASGGALFDEAGNLIGINTFKSPGRNGNYYSLPVTWVKKLLTAPDVAVTTQMELPFWDAPEEKRPFFMQVVNAQIIKHWDELATISQAWIATDSNSSEAWYYLAMAQDKLGRNDEAIAAYKKTLALNPWHTGALYDWGLLASRLGNQAEVERISMILSSISQEVADDFKLAIAPAGTTAQQ